MTRSDLRASLVALVVGAGLGLALRYCSPPSDVQVVPPWVTAHDAAPGGVL